jgi:hypothetical protein
MENEFMKRGYLLPDGCKDLMDVLKPKEQQPLLLHPSAVEKLKKWAEAEAFKALKLVAQDPAKFVQAYCAKIEKELAAQPPIKEEITIPKQISVSHLEQILVTQKSFSPSKNVGTEASGQTGIIGYKPYAPLVFRDLMEMGLCKKVTDLLDFDTVSKILGKYGVTCKLADP